ncbi:hypothetical protein PVAND_006472 [Polypedilum vanderplanki]|uniref:Uncharacterized protein n=1 Tax=Polypedilum vanderplanki TaxID=319348 RepID=A0A9J6C500_POLVA|nr:hypothetical protein PVAND_006472 [Polypedilum vanderplanki]
MDCSYDDNSYGVQEWHEKFLKTYREMEENDVKLVLQTIYESNKSILNFDKYYFQTLISTFEQLTTLKLNNKNVHVVNLISSLILQEKLQSIHFAKINLKIFRNNHDLLKSSKYLEFFVNCICLLILRSMENGSDVKHSNLIKCQLIIIVALQKLFPGEEFSGNRYLMRLFINCHETRKTDEYKDHLQNIFIQQLQTTSLFLQDLFSIQESEKDEKFLRYCILIFYKIIENQSLLYSALTCSEQTNFACNLIKLTANHLYLLDTDSELYDNLTKSTVQLIIASSNISNLHFEVLEKFLIRSILSNDYALSVVCFNIMCQFLSSIDSISTIKSYFKLFQDILLLTWKGEEYMERKQTFIACILKLMYHIYGDHLKVYIVSDMRDFFIKQHYKSAYNFSTTLSALKQNSTVINYNTFIDSLDVTTNGMSQKEMKDYCNFVEIVGKSNWHVHWPMIIKIIVSIIAINDLQKKMVLLLKLNPKEKNLQDVPVIIKHKIIKLAASFTSKENCENLRSYLDSILKVLIKDDFSSRKFYQSIMKQQANDICLKEAEELLRSSKNLFLMHKCFNKKYDA